MKIRTSSVVAIIAVVVIVLAGVAATRLFRGGAPARGVEGQAASAGRGPQGASKPAQAQADERAGAELAEHLRRLCERAGGEVSVAVTHVESGWSAEVQGAKSQPLYSVFKLPLAVAVLKEAEEGRLRVEDKVRVTPEEAAPGWRGNTGMWREPVELSVAELIELSVERSDNTSSDKLLELIGGPEAVTRRMRALGLQNLDIRYSTREFLARQDVHNTGTANDLARLLALLQKGEALHPTQFSLLRGYMERAVTGLKRLRGDLPEGTVVADKTGTGETATNDVGIITLPGGRGHLAMAVLLSGSKLSSEEQEKVIAQLARAAYDAHVAQ